MRKSILILSKSHDSRFANYHNDLYAKIEDVSRKYLNSFGGVQTLFLKSNPTIDHEIIVSGDTLWVRCQDDYWGSLKTKVLAGLFYFYNHTDFDCVFVTNLSTFVNIPSLQQYSNELHDIECRAVLGDYNFHGLNYKFASGAGALYSRELVGKILEHQSKVDHAMYPGTDDIFLGKILLEINAPLSFMSRLDILNSRYDESIIGQASLFSHTRIKFDDNRAFELELHKKLFDSVYLRGA